MPTTKSIKVKHLHLDLDNFRTVHQSNEEHAVNTLISIQPDRFWAIMESILEDEYLPVENIIVLMEKNGIVVKEGNRRIATLKLIHGLVKNIEIPEHIQEKINLLSAEWKAQNASVPCAVFSAKERSVVIKIISRIHGKSESAARYRWPAVATARFARNENKHSEPGLDLLELYLKQGKNIQPQQAERWSGEYPITVLDEAIQKLAPLLGYNSTAELVGQYPKKHRNALEAILLDIGISNLGFKEVRTANWAALYGIQSTGTSGGQSGGSQTGAPAGSAASNTGGNASNGGGTTTNGGGTAGTSPTKRGTAVTPASNDPKSVRKHLKSFKVRGKGREKIATLLDEIKTLKHETHPHAFCFLLRCIFELSAKAYCVDHKNSGGPEAKKKDGRDKELVELLRDVATHIIGMPEDVAKKKLLHGALTELGKKDGILSVTSINNLVHSPSFSIAPPDISLLFGNVFPMIEAMNG